MRQFRMVRTDIWLDNELIELDSDVMQIYLYLLTGPNATNIIGFSRVSISGVSEDLRWGIDRVSRGYDILIREGILAYDEKRKISFIQKEFVCFPPTSSTQVTGYFNTLERFPDCDIKSIVIQLLGEIIDKNNEQIMNAYRGGIEGVSIEHRGTMVYKDKDKYKEIKKEKKSEKEITTVTETEVSFTAEEIVPTKVLSKNESESLESNRVYREKYFEFYGHEPLMGAKDNAIIARLVKKVGRENSPKLIEFYFKSPDPYYKKNGHPLHTLEHQADKLWAELNNPVRAIESLAMNNRKSSLEANNALVIERAMRRTVEHGR